MAANMYRVGDYVYFENSSSNPYLIRRIEELNKQTGSGNVEAKVVCLFRRRDISSNLNGLADNHAREFEEDSKQPMLVDQERHQLKHRELFLSRQFESLPATHIRGKCNVALLNETEKLSEYLDREDCFYYSLVFDPLQKTLIADQGDIRVGPKYQADIPDKLADVESDDRNQMKMETKLWDPDNSLTDRQIDQFLVVARAVGTFARALDCSSSIRQPSLHMSAAAASRDITLFHAMDTLQRNGYDLAKAMSTLVPQGGPVLCRDEMEEWSSSEAMLFEEALEKYGKDFTDIRQDFLSWKSLASIVQFYYMWKTTDRYIQQKRLKVAEADSKLKQVYIPTYTKPNPNQIVNMGPKGGMMNGATGYQKPAAGLTCESCHTTQSLQWYAWGPPNMQCRLCASCWIYWKKYGGLKTPTVLDGDKQRLPSEPRSKGPGGRQDSPGFLSSNSSKLLAKNRQTFLLQTTKLTRIARRLCDDILRPQRAARRPYIPVNVGAIKTECAVRLPKAATKPLRIRPTPRPTLANIMKELGELAARGLTKPRILKGGEGNRTLLNINRGAVSLLGKRTFNKQNGVQGAPSPVHIRQMTASAHLTSNRPFSSGMKTDQVSTEPPFKRQKLNPGDAPDPIVFVATDHTRAIRKALSQSEMRRAARRPCMQVNVKSSASSRPVVLGEPIVLED
ncbi:metastasis-associated protein MTA2 isoform X1 [Amblyraja radiata]|uniref:metastasis-associated protein MTA2 isoform X1 n=1 Tax=Amblyraja radiata TaxID=386614 RepID=UPI00140270AE|nr:metastasis-associated protein MTA2 isoform X1 [Amblyraja radiata]